MENAGIPSKLVGAMLRRMKISAGGWRRAILPAALAFAALGTAQTVNHPTRLILKDGSYQSVTHYSVSGDVVNYGSAERNNEPEQLPASLVDWPATRAWEQAHATGAGNGAVIDPELQQEEADIASRTPLAAPNLQLPVEGSVLALDNFAGGDELVPLAQNDGDLNRNTAHNILKATVNPIASAHQLVQLKGVSAATQLHTGTPVLYIRIGDDLPPDAPDDAFTVDTHGASNAAAIPGGGSASSQYVIVRADVRSDVRIIASFKISMLGQTTRQQDLIPATTELLPGGHWMRVTPQQPLLPGEYALMEVLNAKDVNLAVWDFGVHPDAPENEGVILPLVKKPHELQHR